MLENTTEIWTENKTHRQTEGMEMRTLCADTRRERTEILKVAFGKMQALSSLHHGHNITRSTSTTENKRKDTYKIIHHVEHKKKYLFFPPEQSIV